MTKKAILIVVATVIVVGVGFWASESIAPTLAPTPIVACTQEAKQCPDGSYVGRSGPPM